MADEYIRREDAVDAICSECTVDKPTTCSTIIKGDNWCEEVHILLNLPPADVVPYSIAPDGTLTITVPKGTKVGRVLMQEDGAQYGMLYCLVKNIKFDVLGGFDGQREGFYSAD